jgi:hypothetical protein
MNIEVYRGAGDNPAPQEIVNEYLTTETIGRFRCVAELNENDSKRMHIDADGPKGSVLVPTKLAEVDSRSEIRRGIVNMYARTYDISDNTYTINSHISIETRYAPSP